MIVKAYVLTFRSNIFRDRTGNLKYKTSDVSIIEQQEKELESAILLKGTEL